MTSAQTLVNLASAATAGLAEDSDYTNDPGGLPDAEEVGEG
jgi:hypothetical protein